jgi:hypothetical protein
MESLSKISSSDEYFEDGIVASRGYFRGSLPRYGISAISAIPHLKKGSWSILYPL